MQIFKPEVFQGSFTKKNYFEGWYFKHVSEDLNEVFAFIPGISLSKKDPHAFIQVINGISGETSYISYPLESFIWKKNKLEINIGNSIFTDRFIELDIEDESVQIKGKLNYSALSVFPKKILAPGIMGWYSYVPFMECYHGIVSANHFIEGQLSINNSNINFSGGKGYIEKDWGISFPECWIWIQSNSFQKDDASVFVSIAKIPWLGKFFIGFLAFVFVDGKYHLFASYNRSKISLIERDNTILKVDLQNSKFKMRVEVESKSSGILLAPKSGNMSRRIKESIDSAISVQLTTRAGDIIFEDRSSRAGLEIIEGIFDYFS